MRADFIRTLTKRLRQFKKYTIRNSEWRKSIWYELFAPLGLFLSDPRMNNSSPRKNAKIYFLYVSTRTILTARINKRLTHKLCKYCILYDNIYFTTRLDDFVFIIQVLKNKNKSFWTAFINIWTTTNLTFPFINTVLALRKYISTRTQL